MKKGIESVVAETAEWSNGTVSQDEWTAEWIGTDEVYNPAEGANKMPDPWFRKTFHLKEKPAKATLFVASVGYHEVYVNGQKIGDHLLAPAVTDHTKRARYLAYDIAPALNQGENVIALWLGVSWSIFAPYATPDKPRTPIVIAQADLDTIRDSTSRLVKAARSFQVALDATLSTIGASSKAENASRTDGDLAAFFSPSEIWLRQPARGIRN